MKHNSWAVKVKTIIANYSWQYSAKAELPDYRRLLLAWIIALGLVGLGLLADWYLIFIVTSQPLNEGAQLPVSEKLTPINPYQQLYDDLLYPSVRITTSESIGSGVIIHHKDTKDTKEIYILTAGHVVGNAALVNVELFNSTESLSAFVVSTDTDKDLALLCIHNSSFITHNYCARLAPKNYVPYIFTPVWVIGCSLGLVPRPTAGEITATIGPDWEMNASIWPGNSGGGVFLKGTHELIGIAVWVKICQGQLADTMGGIVPLQTIYEFLTRVGDEFTASGKRFALTDNLSPKTEQSTPQDLEMGGD
jgi:S1-C subfamily serine protease